MEVIVQSLMREYKLQTPNEKIMTMARSLHKAKMVQDKIMAEKKMKSLKFVRFQDVSRLQSNRSKRTCPGGQSRGICPSGTRTRATCKATNMNGNPCKNKVTCGEFCKRHQVDTSSISLLGSVKSLVCE